MAPHSDDEYGNAMSEDEAGAGKTNGNGSGNSRTRGAGTGGNRERWEDIHRSWDQVTEGADGSLAGTVEGLLEAGKRKRLLKDTTPLQRGIIRHVTLIIDLSINMAEKDYRPTRALLALRTASEFISTFFEQNPISQLALLTTHSGLAHLITPMSGNPASHITALSTLITNLSEKQPPAGSPSLQNSLDLARASLAAAPSHGTKEVIIIYGALQSADPGDIHSTIQALVTDRVRVSVVGMAARMAILTELVVRTNKLPSSSSIAASSDAVYGVALHEAHFRTLLMSHTTPPATSAAEQAQRAPSLLLMGFPSRMEEKGPGPSLCVCHHRPCRGGYLCTRCSAKVCGLPVSCPTCELQLVQSTHLARSYHHLFPLRNWREVGWEEVRARTAARRRASTKTVRNGEGSKKSVGQSGVEGTGVDHRPVDVDMDGDISPDKDEDDDEKTNPETQFESSEDACFSCLTPFPPPPPLPASTTKPPTTTNPNANLHPKLNGTTSSTTTTTKPFPQTTTTTTKPPSQKLNKPKNASASSSGASESSRYACTTCGTWFCVECDIYAHEVLHNCAGCLCGNGNVVGDGVGDGEGGGSGGVGTGT